MLYNTTTATVKIEREGDSKTAVTIESKFTVGNTAVAAAAAAAAQHLYACVHIVGGKLRLDDDAPGPATYYWIP